MQVVWTYKNVREYRKQLRMARKSLIKLAKSDNSIELIQYAEWIFRTQGEFIRNTPFD